MCPWETGKQLLSLPESEFLTRLESDGLSEKAAKDFYLSLWKNFIDARTRERDSKLKAKAKKRDPAKLVDRNISVLMIQHNEISIILHSRLTCEGAMELGLEVCSIVVQILFQQIGDSVAWNP